MHGQHHLMCVRLCGWNVDHLPAADPCGGIVYVKVSVDYL